jgi:hypothetical protein
MNKERKLLKFITELIRKTINNEIIWKKISIPNSLIKGTNHIIPICFQALINGKYFILFKRRYKFYTDYDEFEWSEQINIATIDDVSDEIIWENTDNLPNLGDLFIQVQNKVSGIDDFLDTFFD